MAEMEPSAKEAAQRVRDALGRIREELPAIAGLADAFEDLLSERTLLREELPADWDFTMPDIDPDQFRQGVPIAGPESFPVSTEHLRGAVERLAPIMERSFPKVKDSLAAVKAAVLDGALELDKAAKLLLAGDFDKLAVMADEAKLDAGLASFMLGQALKPYVERCARSLMPLPESLQWLKGYCPICGSWPSLSFLLGQGGQRRLKCSFCGHEYRFMRTACPFCENVDHESLEYFYSEDRNHERVEVCHKCKKYVVALDLRDRSDDVLLEVAPLGLIYLDMLAQEKGFSPGALTEWNVLGEAISRPSEDPVQ